nr:UDP-galactopyranose mutase [Lebetimonas sp. JH292]
MIEDDRYFNDKYQGIPKEGYTRNIKIMLNTDFKEVIKIDQDKCENEI